MSKYALIAVIVTLVASFQNCTGANFSAVVDPATAAKTTTSSTNLPAATATPACTLVTSSAPIRILFMVDDSDSTIQTDPNNQHRIAALDAFLAEYGSKTNLTYSFSYFAAASKSFNMVNGGGFVTNPGTPFGVANEVVQALAVFATVPTVANTNYTAAFQTLTSIVQADRALSTAYKYVVVFASDGQPTDLGSTALSEVVGVTQLVSNLLNAGGPPGNLTVSSVYFGSATDTQSITNLSAMASAGGGQFVNTNSASLASLDSIVTVPPSSCQ